MSPSEFAERVNYCLLLCQGWMTSRIRCIQNNTVVGGRENSSHQVNLEVDCVVLKENSPEAIGLEMERERGTLRSKYIDTPQLFVHVCDRLGLLAIDEGDYFLVKTKLQ